jgi:hypothetical protein
MESDQQIHTEGQDAPQYPASWDGLKQALAALGDTADEIAASLQAQGIKGAREDSACCPVARYLEKASPAGSRTSKGVRLDLALRTANPPASARSRRRADRQLRPGVR